MEKTGCKIICGAPTTLAAKGLMMMMMMMMMMMIPWCNEEHASDLFVIPESNLWRGVPDKMLVFTD